MGAGDFEGDDATPPPHLVPEDHPPRSQEDIDRAAVIALNKRVAELEALEPRVADLERELEKLKSQQDSTGRAMRELRQALARWMRAD